MSIDNSALSAGTITVGDFHLNRLGFGAMRITGKGIWGEPADPEQAKQVLRRAVELDINFIDTADAYGPEVSERLIHEALYPYEGIVIATKGGLTRSGPNQWVPDCSPAHLREACEASLARLGVEQIDLYQLHTVDPDVAFEESFQMLLDLQQEGKIHSIGLSNIEPEHFKTALAMGKFVSVQNNYNVLNREHEDV
jgi:pyridoxine 4-dehydrogenase